MGFEPTTSWVYAPEASARTTALRLRPFNTVIGNLFCRIGPWTWRRISGEKEEEKYKKFSSFLSLSLFHSHPLSSSLSHFLSLSRSLFLSHPLSHTFSLSHSLNLFNISESDSGMSWHLSRKQVWEISFATVLIVRKIIRLTSTSTHTHPHAPTRTPTPTPTPTPTHAHTRTHD